MQQDLPAFLCCSPTSSGVACDSKVEESRVYIRMDFTYQEFLLHRILWKRLGRKSDGLFESSCEVISTLLDLVTLLTKSGRSVQKLAWDVRFNSTTTPIDSFVNDFLWLALAMLRGSSYRRHPNCRVATYNKITPVYESIAVVDHSKAKCICLVSRLCERG